METVLGRIGGLGCLVSVSIRWSCVSVRRVWRWRLVLIPIKRISGQLGINPEALRTWVRAVEQGGRNERGEISDQEAHIRALEAENRELRRANEILKAASAFFGAEPGRLGR